MNRAYALVSRQKEGERPKTTRNWEIWGAPYALNQNIEEGGISPPFDGNVRLGQKVMGGKGASSGSGRRTRIEHIGFGKRVSKNRSGVGKCIERIGWNKITELVA